MTIQALFGILNCERTSEFSSGLPLPIAYVLEHRLQRWGLRSAGVTRNPRRQISGLGRYQRTRYGRRLELSIEVAMSARVFVAEAATRSCVVESVKTTCFDLNIASKNLASNEP